MSSVSVHEAGDLYFQLRELAPHDPMYVLTRLRSFLETRSLRSEMVAVLVLGQHEKVSIEPITERGRAVLEEVIVRSEVLPCPPGMCEPENLGLCRWCGALLH